MYNNYTKMKIKKVIKGEKMNKRKILIEDYFKHMTQALEDSDSEFLDGLIKTIGINEKTKNIIMSKKISIYIISSYVKLIEYLITEKKLLKNNNIGEVLIRTLFENKIHGIDLVELTVILSKLSKKTMGENASPKTCSLIFMKNIKEIQELTDEEKEQLYRFFLEFVESVFQNIMECLSTILIIEKIEEDFEEKNNTNFDRFLKERETLSEESVIELSVKEGDSTRKITTDKGILMYQTKELYGITCRNIVICCREEFLIYKDSFEQIETSVINSVKLKPNKINFLESLIEKEELSLQNKRKMLNELKK